MLFLTLCCINDIHKEEKKPSYYRMSKYLFFSPLPCSVSNVIARLLFFIRMQELEGSKNPISKSRSSWLRTKRCREKYLKIVKVECCSYRSLIHHTTTMYTTLSHPSLEQNRFQNFTVALIKVLKFISQQINVCKYFGYYSSIVITMS